MKRIKKFMDDALKITACFALCIMFAPIAHASDSDNITKIENDLQIVIDRSSKIDLYGNDDNVIAEYYDLNSLGYIIVNKNNNDVIEYSTEDNNLFITNRDQKYYYGGPLNYFVKSADGVNLETIDTQEVISKEVAILQKTNESLKLPSTRSIPLQSSFTYKTAYNPRTYSYNPNGICGSTASAILLMYYRDHVSSAYVPSNLATSDGVALIKHLIKYIDGATPGANYYDMTSGLTNYLNTRNVIFRVQRLNIVEGANKLYDGKKPIIVGTLNHPTYKDHWVVGYGFNSSYGLVNYFIVNNGWGQNGININAGYVDGTIVI